MAENLPVNTTLDCHETVALLDLVTRYKGELNNFIRGRAMEKHQGELCIHGKENAGQIQELIELLQKLQLLVYPHVQSQAETRDNKGRLKRDSGIGSTTSTELQAEQQTEICSLPLNIPATSSDNIHCEECSLRQSASIQESLLRNNLNKDDEKKLDSKRWGIRVSKAENAVLTKARDNTLQRDEGIINSTMNLEDDTDYLHVHQRCLTHPKSVDDSRPEEKTEEDTLLDADAKDGAGKKEKDVQ